MGGASCKTKGFVPLPNKEEEKMPMLGFVTWDVNPDIFELFGRGIRWYGLLWASGLLLGYWLLLRFAKFEGFPQVLVDRLAVYSAIGVVVGARLGHCLFYDPGYYLANPGEILMVWKGGLASHGGALGVLVAVWLAARKSQVPMLWLLDRIVIPIGLIATMIRLGNLMNSEIYGHVTQLPWGFIFVRDGQTLPRHPTQLYEAACYLVMFVGMLLAYWRSGWVRSRRGLLFSMLLIWAFGTRFFLEYLKEVQSGFEAGWVLDMGQILSIPFFLLGVGMLWWSLRQPGWPERVWEGRGRKEGKKIT